MVRLPPFCIHKDAELPARQYPAHMISITYTFIVSTYNGTGLADSLGTLVPSPIANVNARLASGMRSMLGSVDGFPVYSRPGGGGY